MAEEKKITIGPKKTWKRQAEEIQDEIEKRRQNSSDSIRVFISPNYKKEIYIHQCAYQPQDTKSAISLKRGIWIVLEERCFIAHLEEGDTMTFKTNLMVG